MAQEITKVHHWLLGRCEVEPPVPVVNTDFITWEPDAAGHYPAQALHYSLMHRIVSAGDPDLVSGKNHSRSSLAVHTKSLLNTYVVTDFASRFRVLNADGTPHEHLAL